MTRPLTHYDTGADSAPRPVRRTRTFGSALAPQATRSRVAHLGIERRTNVVYDRAQRPLTDRQALVLNAVTDTAQPARDLAPAIGLTANQMTGALLTLAAKNLVIKTQAGWKLAA